MVTRETTINDSGRPTARPVERAASRQGSPGLTLAIVCAAVFMANLDLLIVNIAFPAIQQDFADAGRSALSWVLNGYAIVFAALLVPAGRLADRFGRRLGFQVGLGIFTLGSALCAIAVNPETLVAARLVQAAGAAALIPTSLGLLLQATPPAERIRAIGIWAAVAGMASAAGPVLGGLLVELSWRWVFLVNLPIGGLAALAASRYVIESRDLGPSRRPDFLGAGLLIVGIGTLALGIVQGPDWGWTSLGVVGSLALAAVAIAGFAVRTFTHDAPIIEPALLRVRTFAVANVAVLCYMTSLAAMILISVEFFTGVWGYSALRAGLAISPGPISVTLTTLRNPRFIARFGHSRVAAAGALFMVAGCAYWVLFMEAERNYLVAALPGMIVAGIGVGLAMPAQLAAGSSALPPERFATGSAVFNMSRQIGAVLGVAILVAILGSLDPADPLAAFERGWIFIAAAALASGAASLAIGRVRR